MCKQIIKCSLVKPACCIVLMTAWLLCCFIPSTTYSAQKLYDDLFSVSFPTEKDGWACGRWGAVLHSVDGGATWNRQESKTEMTLMSIHFVDPQNGWAAGDGGIVIHTADGGKTWERQPTPINYFNKGIYFADLQTGWVVSERSNILHTKDGGKSWVVQFKDMDIILNNISFSDPLHGWVVGESGYIYHTEDGGATWKLQAGFLDENPDTGEIVSGTTLFDVVAIDSLNAWAVGIGGYVTATEDGGKTWKIVDIGASLTPLFDICADSSGTIAITGKGSGFSSSDKGRTWKPIQFTPPITYGWLYGIARIGSSHFITVGFNGAIYRNSSEGWVQVKY
jgi:photosystem II stability/assembly factor-like uncharacterized protein